MVRQPIQVIRIHLQIIPAHVVVFTDANVPSLISLPYLGFVNATNEVYQNTRRLLLSQEGNPYYGVGPVIRGIGGQHIDEMHPWPMGIVSEVITGINDKASCLTAFPLWPN